MLLEGGGLAPDADAGAAQIDRALSSGAAAERFAQMVAMMGGPLRLAEDWRRFLPEAPVIREVAAPEAGYVTAMEGEKLGLAVVALGGGRQVESDVVDPAVGLSEMVRLGAWVEKGAPLCRVHAAREEAAAEAEAAVLGAVEIGADRPQVPRLIHERIG
jgi:thymidine phosphorylase